MKYTIIIILLLVSQLAKAQNNSDVQTKTTDTVVKGTSNDAAAMAKKLANPVASLISLPIQSNLDVGIGSFHGYRSTTNIQPVIPIGITEKWNLIARVVLPVVSQQNIYDNKGTTQTGLGDAVVSAFLSPAEAKNGLVWGLGPVFLVPVATDPLLGTQKFGIGPTAVILKQAKSWTVGALVNQIWSVAGSADRSEVSQMYVQPFLAYIFKSGAGIGLSNETTLNWISSTTTSFLIPNFTAITKFGKQIAQFQIGPRIQLAGPKESKSNFGLRAAFVFVFPK